MMWAILSAAGALWAFIYSFSSVSSEVSGSLEEVARLRPLKATGVSRAEVLERAAREVLASRGASGVSAYRDGAPSEESLRGLESALQGEDK